MLDRILIKRFRSNAYFSKELTVFLVFLFFINFLWVGIFQPPFVAEGAVTVSALISKNTILTSNISGQAQLPSDSTTVQLSSTAALDVSAGISSASSNSIIVGGVEKTLNNFTSGNL